MGSGFCIGDHKVGISAGTPDEHVQPNAARVAKVPEGMHAVATRVGRGVSEEAVGSWSHQRSAAGLDALNGLFGGTFLLLGMLFGSSGFGGQTYTGFGDHPMTASEAVAAVVVFAGRRKATQPGASGHLRAATGRHDVLGRPQWVTRLFGISGHGGVRVDMMCTTPLA